MPFGNPLNRTPVFEVWVLAVNLRQYSIVKTHVWKNIHLYFTNCSTVNRIVGTYLFILVINTHALPNTFTYFKVNKSWPFMSPWNSVKSIPKFSVCQLKTTKKIQLAQGLLLQAWENFNSQSNYLRSMQGRRRIAHSSRARKPWSFQGQHAFVASFSFNFAQWDPQRENLGVRT